MHILTTLCAFMVVLLALGLTFAEDLPQNQCMYTYPNNPSYPSYGHVKPLVQFLPGKGWLFEWRKVPYMKNTELVVSINSRGIDPFNKETSMPGEIISTGSTCSWPTPIGAVCPEGKSMWENPRWSHKDMNASQNDSNHCRTLDIQVMITIEDAENDLNVKKWFNEDKSWRYLQFTFTFVQMVQDPNFKEGSQYWGENTQSTSFVWTVSYPTGRDGVLDANSVHVMVGYSSKLETDQPAVSVFIQYNTTAGIFDLKVTDRGNAKFFQSQQINDIPGLSIVYLEGGVHLTNEDSFHSSFTLEGIYCQGMKGTPREYTCEKTLQFRYKDQDAAYLPSDKKGPSFQGALEFFHGQDLHHFDSDSNKRPVVINTNKNYIVWRFTDVPSSGFRFKEEEVDLFVNDPVYGWKKVDWKGALDCRDGSADKQYWSDFDPNILSTGDLVLACAIDGDNQYMQRDVIDRGFDESFKLHVRFEGKNRDNTTYNDQEVVTFKFKNPEFIVYLPEFNGYILSARKHQAKFPEWALITLICLCSFSAVLVLCITVGAIILVRFHNRIKSEDTIKLMSSSPQMYSSRTV